MSTPVSDASETWIDPLFDAIVSEIQLTGFYDRVQTHEPKRPPGYNLTAAVWLQSLDPYPPGSGLNMTSALAVFIARTYSNMLKEPQDGIDPQAMRAAVSFMRRFNGNFDFGLHPLVRCVDLLGESGISLSLNAGYVDIDNTKFRVLDVTIPIILNDVWTQEP